MAKTVELLKTADLTIVHSKLADNVNSIGNYQVICQVISVTRKEASASFNNALNTYYLQLYGIGHMVKDHSDSERGNLLPTLHGLILSISSNLFYVHSCHRQDSTYHSFCYTSRGALCGTRNSSVGPS